MTKSKHKRPTNDMRRMDLITKVIVRAFFGGLAGVGIAFFIHAYFVPDRDMPWYAYAAITAVVMLLAVFLWGGLWRAIREIANWWAPL